MFRVAPIAKRAQRLSIVIVSYDKRVIREAVKMLTAKGLLSVRCR